MATTPTKNAVPSESPRDLKFNAGKIDEFVTSLAHRYVDRFGNNHHTIEGIKKLAMDAISAFGWIPVDSFQDGAILTKPNEILRWKLPDGDGDYYRWDGDFPKSIPADSTPESTGGVGAGAWINVGDAAIREIIYNSDIAIKVESIDDVKNIDLVGVKNSIEINGTIFSLSENPSMNSRVPRITTKNGLYLTPRSGMISNIHSEFVKGSSVPAEYETTPELTRILQSMCIDAVNGRLFFFSSEDRTGAYVNETISILEYEYDIENGSVGNLVKIATGLHLGHGDHTAVIVRDDGSRVIITCQPTTDASFGPTQVIKIEWDSSESISDSDVELIYNPERFTFVTWYDSEKILLGNWECPELCYASDLANGVYRPASTYSYYMTEAHLINTSQQIHFLEGNAWGIGGGNIAQQMRAVISRFNGTQLDAVYDAFDKTLLGTTETYEIEGIDFRFDRSSSKFIPFISVDRKSDGATIFYNLEEPTGKGSLYPLQSPVKIKSTFNDSEGPFSQIPGDFVTRSFFLSGVGSTVNPNTFSIVTARDGVVGGSYRQYNRISSFFDGEHPTHYYQDGDEDQLTGAGHRFYMGPGGHVLHITDRGISYGETIPTDGVASQLQLFDQSFPVGAYSKSGIGFVSDGDLDLACLSGSALQFGGVTIAGNTATPAVWYTMNDGRLSPSNDNARALGSSSNRFSTVYAGTGTINTSDAREKTAVRVMTDAEISAAKDMADEIGFFQWLTAVSEKGNLARMHVGLTVQRAIEIMESYGLEPFSYGFICYDEWDAEYETIPALYERVTLDDGTIENGDEISPEKQKLVREAGDQYSFRMDQLCLFISAGFNARLKALEASR